MNILEGRDCNFWKGKKQGFLFCVFDKLSKLRFISNFKIWNNQISTWLMSNICKYIARLSGVFFLSFFFQQKSTQQTVHFWIQTNSKEFGNFVISLMEQLDLNNSVNFRKDFNTGGGCSVGNFAIRQMALFNCIFVYLKFLTNIFVIHMIENCSCSDIKSSLSHVSNE